MIRRSGYKAVVDGVRGRRRREDGIVDILKAKCEESLLKNRCKALPHSPCTVSVDHKAWLSTINLAICKAIDPLEMLKRKEEMLSAIKEKQLKNGENGLSRDALDDGTKKAET